MKTSNVPGTVAAFFFYRNDTCEIDIESLSRFSDPFKTYFAVQPQIYDNGQASLLTNEKHDLMFDPTQVNYIIEKKKKKKKVVPFLSDIIHTPRRISMNIDLIGYQEASNSTSMTFLFEK